MHIGLLILSIILRRLRSIANSMTALELLCKYFRVRGDLEAP